MILDFGLGSEKHESIVFEASFRFLYRQSKIQNPKSKWGWRFAIVLAFVLCGAVASAQPAKMPKIGYLQAGFGASATYIQGTQRELRALGYIEGKNITFISRFAETKYDRLPALADELVRLKVDIIVMPGSNDTRAALQSGG